MLGTLTPNEYAETVHACAAAILEGYSYDEVFTSPVGPVSRVVGKCDIDTLEACVRMAVYAHTCTARGVHWVARVYLN